MMCSFFLRAAPSVCAVVLGALALGQAPLEAQRRFQDFDTQPIVVTPAQREAVDRGLAWLAAHQRADGAWPGKVGYKLNNDYRYDMALGDGPHVGVTSLACMAFLAGGHLPGRGAHSEVIERGLAFVLSCCNSDGYITHAGTRMYSHAFATLFLAEIYGMTHRQDVREHLQKAVDFIVTTQNDEGGWRYVPFQPDSDMSIVVCQVLALRAARNIGIRVPKSTIDLAAQYVVDSAVTGERTTWNGRLTRDIGSFHYQRSSGGSRSSFPLTAAGVTALHGVGIYSDELIQRGLEYLQSDLDSFNARFSRGGHYFFWYGHYYGVQAMYTAGTAFGVEHWKRYFEVVRTELLKLQRDDGSWPNDVGPGPAFGTAMAVLVLEIPYRYLPIFQR
ncbi:MAG: prenyltransferase/squalene oxidase repeat-containing protein [Planctomycetota bacterium]